MGAPKIYRWDDANAPIANGENTSAINILRACLIDGYGTQTPPGGWTMPFVNVDGTKAVFRNDSVNGTGMFLQVDGTWNTSYNHMTKLQGYESMSSIDDGLGPFHDSSSCIMSTSDRNNEIDPKIWILIADERCFYYVSYHYINASDGIEGMKNNTGGAGYCGTPVFFGDIISLVSDDPYGCVLIGGVSVSPSYGSYLIEIELAYQEPSVTLPQNVARHFSGMNKISGIHLVAGGGPIDETRSGANGMSRSYGIDMISRPYLCDETAFSMRGWLPGFYHMCHPYSEFEPFEMVTIDGINLITLWAAGRYQFYHGGFHLDIGATFRP